jgi:hypothetical protein
MCKIPFVKSNKKKRLVAQSTTMKKDIPSNKELVLIWAVRLQRNYLFYISATYYPVLCMLLMLLITEQLNHYRSLQVFLKLFFLFIDNLRPFSYSVTAFFENVFSNFFCRITHILSLTEVLTVRKVHVSQRLPRETHYRYLYPPVITHSPYFTTMRG